MLYIGALSRKDYEKIINFLIKHEIFIVIQNDRMMKVAVKGVEKKQLEEQLRSEITLERSVSINKPLN